MASQPAPWSEEEFWRQASNPNEESIESWLESIQDCNIMSNPDGLPHTPGPYSTSGHKPDENNLKGFIPAFFAAHRLYNSHHVQEAVIKSSHWTEPSTPVPLPPVAPSRVAPVGRLDLEKESSDWSPGDGSDEETGVRTPGSPGTPSRPEKTSSGGKKKPAATTTPPAIASLPKNSRPALFTALSTHKSAHPPTLPFSSNLVEPELTTPYEPETRGLCLRIIEGLLGCTMGTFVCELIQFRA
ncbi:hypothetical protein BU23DRAFT_575612 [Bimuria novae-zelandiae CBS 107.79]|uniref:Uncharacterized protein n=1 Tax=Bimuria novae-zelandiae CBS 107.79 TaxID=1447943 RepID=A0A6A5UKP8_9PLEO|nr:hypothetical protein BU23DRAFT_575612 [Bimuria novae-zelandiae CBS 107.79]